MQRDILHKSLVNNLKDLTLDRLVSMFYNYFDAVEDFDKLCRNINAGKKISLLFNPHRLDTPTITNPVTIFQALQDEHLLDGFARMVCYDLSVGAGEPFYHSCRRGFNGVQMVDEFPPFVARQVYQTYGNKDNLRVLDPCCGWGGRMIGCASIPNTTYVGCEPSTKTYEGLLKLGKWLHELQPTFKYQIYNMPYEEFDSGNEKFDIALTSPPYYDTEKYSDEDTNSCNRYHSLEDWSDNFFAKLITSTVDRLDTGGVFILNIGDRKYPLSDICAKICEDENINCSRIYDFLAGYGEGKEKFYLLSRDVKVAKNTNLF